MNTLTTSHTNKTYPNQWVKAKDNFFSADHVLHAYETGKKEALDLKDKLIKDRLETNINLTGDYASEIFEELNNQGFEPINAYLRMNSWNEFDLMFLIPERQLVNKKIYDIYNFLSDFEENKMSELFHFTTCLCGSSTDKFNEGKVFAEGYIFKLK